MTQETVARTLCDHWSQAYKGSQLTFEVEDDMGWGVRQYDDGYPQVFWSLAQDSAGQWFASTATNMVALSHVPGIS